jgi:hypothetical protein
MNHDKAKYQPPFGESFVTIELDVDADMPPTLFVKFVHCTIDWREDDNIFLSDIIANRTTNIDWTSSPTMSSYYSWRGRVSVPNDQVKFNFPGNWKAKFYEFYKDTTVFAECRIFVVNPKIGCDVAIYSDFYSPEYNVSNSSFSIEARTTPDLELFDNRLETTVLYLNNRWSQPIYISENDDYLNYNKIYRYKYKVMTTGFASAGKIFRIDGLPAENKYRFLNLSNLVEFPMIKAPSRLPFSDERRDGNFSDEDDDGAMITSYISSSSDDYVNLEFVLDPEGRITGNDLFVVGSFNNWTPSPEWQMYYDEEMREYRVRHWVRRARHDYLYATGTYNAETKKVEKLSFDEFEGNTSMSAHTFIALVYYHEFEYGGYDALIAVGASNAYGPFRRR